MNHPPFHPKATYTALVRCSNCGARERKKIQQGVPIALARCHECGCQSLHKEGRP